MVSESTLIVARLARTLKDLGIPYVIAGSFASSLHGIPRTTQNVDIVADLKLAIFSSLEDTLLHKLIWYRMGNEVSETQWRDVIGMLKVKRESLDRLYLERWAPILKVEDLLQRAEAEIES